ncbi:MAG: DUF4292 domain-containing protein [Paludibacteraceae bacterium]|nr:DUF4292 domain-containing protein [Paludibacteraceae bacterium]
MLSRWTILFVFLLTLFASCSSLKHRSSKTDKDALPSLSYETFGAKASVSMGGLSVNANLRMKRDSCLSISIQPFAGVEVARLFVTNQEVCLVDRINKRYAVMDLSSTDEVPSEYLKLLSVRKLQALLTNQLFLLDERDAVATKSDFSATEIADSWLLQYADPKSRFSQEFTLNGAQRVKNGSVSSSQGSIRWDYLQFEPLGNGYPFPMEVNLLVTQSSTYQGGYHSPQTSAMELGVTYKKIELNKDYSFSNPIPKGYQKVSVRKILSLLNFKR